ncbi:hypothetical protein SAMN05216517_10698 [Janthinobacterium sp. OK676]|uniref:hypothetical protein n=1 Tax=Janthinobacterium sp. OK676 TaxID=1855295 RepID=UPI00088C1F29|nr:hypothetical protein [Janthinobacterium sp. OK676]SDM76905.1 hypothetical protein SAMN05216517_10698 [Janthinobacterium sp. OK676]
MFDKSSVRAVQRLTNLDQHSEGLLRNFSGLLASVALVEEYHNHKFHSLHVEQVDDYIIDTSYLGKTVRFQLFLTYKEDKPIGRVVGLLKYLIFEKVHFEFLGEFTFDSLGHTNLPPEKSNAPRTVARNADEIVIDFLDKAIALTPKEFAAE